MTPGPTGSLPSLSTVGRGRNPNPAVCWHRGTAPDISASRHPAFLRVVGPTEGFHDCRPVRRGAKLRSAIHHQKLTHTSKNGWLLLFVCFERAGPAYNFIFVGEQLKQEIWEKYQVIRINDFLTRPKNPKVVSVDLCSAVLDRQRSLVITLLQPKQSFENHSNTQNVLPHTFVCIVLFSLEKEKSNHP